MKRFLIRESAPPSGLPLPDFFDIAREPRLPEQLQHLLLEIGKTDLFLLPRLLPPPTPAFKLYSQVLGLKMFIIPSIPKKTLVLE